MVPVEALAKTPMFQGLSQKHLEAIAEISQLQVFDTGATIFLEGQQAVRLFALEDGKVALEMKIQLDPSQTPRHTIIDVLSPGDVFAWSALVEPYALTMSARCIKRATVVAINADDLRKLLEADCSLGFTVMVRLAGVISRRLHDTRAQLIGERGLALMYESLRDSC
ncbi:MAG: cyclic nucleotide-binding domain-containing protein [Chloroflexi bacterium]|nr:cyclic nucleotide-binding domain-containing protein [Chloroflexota bacterium]MCL5108085.1 cyclic nucleotide-binding domain-containing protein [Chloroflexota bacterium]